MKPLAPFVLPTLHPSLVVARRERAQCPPAMVTVTPRKLMLCPAVKPVPEAITFGVGKVSSTTCQSVALVNCSDGMGTACKRACHRKRGGSILSGGSSE